MVTARICYIRSSSDLESFQPKLKCTLKRLGLVYSVLCAFPKTILTHLNSLLAQLNIHPNVPAQIFHILPEYCADSATFLISGLHCLFFCFIPPSSLSIVSGGTISGWSSRADTSETSGGGASAPTLSGSGQTCSPVSGTSAISVPGVSGTVPSSRGRLLRWSSRYWTWPRLLRRPRTSVVRPRSWTRFWSWTRFRSWIRFWTWIRSWTWFRSRSWLRLPWARLWRTSSRPLQRSRREVKIQAQNEERLGVVGHRTATERNRR